MNPILSSTSKSPKLLISCYYTINTSYQNLAKTLKSSLDPLNLDYHIEGIEDQGSWEKNTHYKPYFIKKCLDNNQCDLLYVDADAIFRSYPKLIESLDCDIAYRTENFRWRKDEALSGTIYLRNCNEVKELVNRWIEINESRPAERMKPETWEQKNLQTAQREMKSIRYYNLPPEYTFITDHTRRMYPGLSPVIEHFQNSREVFKKNI
jgi:hypothetical protein